MIREFIDELYIEKLAEDNNLKKYSPMIPQVMSAGTLGSAIAWGLQAGILNAMNNLFMKGKISKPTLDKITENTNKYLHAGKVGGSFALMSAINEIRKNVSLANEDRAKLDEIYNNLKSLNNVKTASEYIDFMYKTATIETPTNKEKEKANTPKEKTDLQTIKCENCDYEGETTVYGECPNCGAIGGVKPSEVRNLREESDDNDPYEGTSVYDADHLDRANL